MKTNVDYDISTYCILGQETNVDFLTEKLGRDLAMIPTFWEFFKRQQSGVYFQKIEKPIGISAQFTFEDERVLPQKVWIDGAQQVIFPETYRRTIQKKIVTLGS